MVVIPDGGDSQGKTIEVAEKNLLWIRFHVQGKQASDYRIRYGYRWQLEESDEWRKHRHIGTSIRNTSK